MKIGDSSTNVHRVSWDPSASGRAFRSRLDTDFAPKEIGRDSHPITAELPNSKPWTYSSSLGWYAHAPVWWVRRIVPGNRDSDCKAVLNFLRKKELISSDGGLRSASVNRLLKLEIDKKFWWLSQVQISRLAAWLSLESKFLRQPKRSDEILIKKINETIFAYPKVGGG